MDEAEQNQQMHINIEEYLILHYKYSMPPTCLQDSLKS
jgi:hypothetical protein